MLCPANVATGGTESIHRACNEMNKRRGIKAKIFYKRVTDKCPQPTEYAEYDCDYVTELPEGFTGAVVFPEIWADQCIEPEYDKCVKAINWAGVDVYSWNVPKDKRFQFMQAKNVIHLAHSAYAVDYLNGLGIPETDIFRFSGNLNQSFFKLYDEVERTDIVLYNPVKRTEFDNRVISLAKAQGIILKPIEKMTREQVIETMHQSKLYIDFGLFSGRERLPREAALCGCCVLTSRSGAAGYYKDVPIPDLYKFDIHSTDPQVVINMIKIILANYKDHYHEFDYYRKSLRQDMKNFPEECKAVAKEMIRRYNEI